MPYNEENALRLYALGVLRDPQATDHDRGCARRRLTQRWDATRLSIKELEILTALLEKGLDDRGAALEVYESKDPRGDDEHSHLGCTVPDEDTKIVTEGHPKPVSTATTIAVPPPQSHALAGFLARVKPEKKK